MLKKYSNVIGLSVIVAQNGIKIGSIKDIIFRKDNKEVIGIVLEKSNHTIKGDVVLLNDILSLGNDALIIDNPSCLVDYKKLKKSREMGERVQLRGLKIFTQAGDDIGIVQDVLFDYRTGKVEGVQVSDGLVQDIMQGRNILPFFGKIEIGEHNILVSSEAAEEMINSNGGLIGRFENI